MADNLAVTPGVGASVAADDVGGNLYQRIKVSWGPDGTANEVDVATGKPLPIQLRSATGVDLIKAGSTLPATSDPALVVTIRDVNANGPATPANSTPTVNADQYAQYETVAASASAQVLGGAGAIGDYLAGVLVFPGAANCGVVTILDNAITIGTFPGGGTTVLPSLVPFMIPVGLFSVSGAWKITTGASVTAVGIGKFSA